MNQVDIERALTSFASNAPVCLCDPQGRQHCGSPGFDWCGPQRKAHAARAALARDCVDLPQFSVALGHALIGEGRAEFDQAFAAWLKGPPR